MSAVERHIDIHSHILPGVDDGAQDMDMAMTMLRSAEGMYEEVVLNRKIYFPECALNELFHPIDDWTV